MLRFAISLAFVLPLAAVAAPVPPPTEKELLAKYWGKTEGEGEFELNRKQLTIRTVGKPAHGLIGVINGAEITMPRATRTVSGDFEVSVRVADAALPNKQSKYEGAGPGTRAGVFIMGGGYAIELYFYQYYVQVFNGVLKEEPTQCVWLDTWYPRGGSGSQLRDVEAGKSTYLRITRKDKVMTVSYSSDGKEWSKPFNPQFNPQQALEFPNELTAGVFFGQSTYQIASATFDGFTVEKPKQEKK